MKSSFSPNKNKMKLIKSLNLSLQPPSPDSYKRQNNNILFTLPPIDSVTKKQELMKPTSLLTRFIHDRTRTIINTTKSELKKPIKISIENINKIK